MKDENYTKVEKMTAWAQERGHSMSDLAHAWLLAQPSVASVISGATRLEQITANAASGSWSLTPDEVREINEIL
jgi:aryl-alcohol dehydrogenase-like predicted oxidoreductase